MGRHRYRSSIRWHRTHLNGHTVQPAQPEEAVPARCRDIALDLQLTPVGGLERLGELAAAPSERLASVTHRRAS
jgi:hypothetical protein